MKKIKETSFKVFCIISQQLQLLKEEVKRVYPIEACAVLFGKITRKEIVVEKIVVTPNISPKSQTEFEIDPEIFYRALMQTEGNGLKHIGFFHSHPAPAIPSTRDVKYMKRWGDAVWLIFSTINYHFAAFQMRNGEAHELIVKTDEI